MGNGPKLVCKFRAILFGAWPLSLLSYSYDKHKQRRLFCRWTSPMSTWATKRQMAYLFLTALILSVVVGLPTFFSIHKAPTCNDGLRNQGEAGSDCGGPCALLCLSQVPKPVIRWARSFNVVEGIYNAVALIENTALDIGTDNIGYSFKLYDSRNVLIAERTGTTFLPPKLLVPVFEGAIQTGERVPARTFFELIGTPEFKRSLPGESEDITVQNTSLRNEASTPRLEATIVNSSVRTVKNVEVVAILYDSAGNAVAASRTIIDAIEKGSTARAVFSWFGPFSSAVTRTEVIPRVRPE